MKAGDMKVLLTMALAAPTVWAGVAANGVRYVSGSTFGARKTKALRLSRAGPSGPRTSTT